MVERLHSYGPQTYGAMAFVITLMGLVAIVLRRAWFRGFGTSSRRATGETAVWIGVGYLLSSLPAWVMVYQTANSIHPNLLDLFVALMQSDDDLIGYLFLFALLSGVIVIQLFGFLMADDDG
jgi:hypothetical protein